MVLGTVSQDQLGSQGRVAGAGCRGGNLDHEPPGQRGHSCCCHHNCEERQQRVALAPLQPLPGRGDNQIIGPRKI